MAKTIKSAFRDENGFYWEKKCKDCAHCQRFEVGLRKVYKCTEIGISGSAATDIRLKDPGCKLYEERKDGNVG